MSAVGRKQTFCMFDDKKIKYRKLMLYPENMGYVYTRKDQDFDHDRLGGFKVRKGLLDGGMSLLIQTYYSLFKRLKHFNVSKHHRSMCIKF